jgi:magnesium transporter
MQILGKKKSFKIGQPPGSAVFTGIKKLDVVKINLIAYNEQEFEEFEIGSLADLKIHLQQNHRVLWVDIIGIHDEKLLEEIGLLFDLHRLTLEDILNVEQRPENGDFRRLHFY